jgi:hypothetical protein
MLLKSRMRENIQSGSVRGLIAIPERLLLLGVCYELYSTFNEVIFIQNSIVFLS